MSVLAQATRKGSVWAACGLLGGVALLGFSGALSPPVTIFLAMLLALLFLLVRD